MKKMLIACVCMGLSTPTAFAGTCTILPGMGGKWSEDASWNEGIAPKKGDIVIVDAKETAAKGVVIEATKADIDFLETTGVGDIVFAGIGSKAKNPVLQVTVGPGEISTYSGVITNNVSSDDYSGCLVKKGEGHLRLTHDKGNYHLAIILQVDEGILQLPAVDSNYRNQHYAKFVVNAPGVLWTLTSSASSSVHAYLHDGITGDGIITNPTPGYATILDLQAAKSRQRTFSGVLSGNVRVSVDKNSGHNFTNHESPTTGASHTLKENAEIGLVSIGGTAGGGSNVGSLGAGVFELYGSTATLRYLGDGEVSYATFRASSESKASRLFTLNGGPNGGYEHRGIVDFSASTNVATVLVLDGTNRTACTFASAITNDVTRIKTTRLVKRGNGTWNVKEIAGTSLNGVVAVEDGTLTFDTLSEAGYPCALGWASLLQEDYPSEVFDTSKTVDYAFLLGTASTTGTLASVSASAESTRSRPLALLGDGRLLSNAAPLAWKGVSAAATGVHTLTLDGAATGSVLTDVLDGDVGRVKIVKEGPGDWTLNGALDFTGGIEVRGGSLALASAGVTTNYFSFYRVMFKENGGGSTMDVARLGFFNDSGYSQATGLVANASANGRPWKLQPGEAAYFNYNPFFNYQKDMTNEQTGVYIAFHPVNDSSFMRLWNRATDEFVRAKTNSWLGVAFRLPEDAEPVTSYDIGARFKCTNVDANRAPISWSVEGSTDGVNWIELSSIVSNVQKQAENQQWMSACAKFFKTSTSTNMKGWPLMSSYEVTPASFPRNIDSICVALNATLSSARTVGTRKIVVEAAGGGVVSGFKLSDDGVIDVVGVPAKGAFEIEVDLSEVELPDNVPILVNGQVDRRDVILSADRKSIKGIPSGMILLIR